MRRNENTIQNFNHLKYYPRNNIDKKTIDFFLSLNLTKDVPTNYIIDRFNFYLETTNKQLSFKLLNNKKVIYILEDFYSFMFSQNNFFNYSKSGKLRYLKFFNKLQEKLSITISRKYDFDYSLLCQEKLYYFKGWNLYDNRLSIFVNLINFYNTFGRNITEDYFDKINSYFKNVRIKTFNYTLFNSIFDYLAEHKKLTLQHNDIVFLMKKFFLLSEEKKNNINASKQYWNDFILFINFLFPFNNHERYILKKNKNDVTNIKKENDQFIKTKLITEIPLEIYDNEAFDILFKKINQDVKLINDWASSIIDYHYNCFLNVDDNSKIKAEYFNKPVKQIAILKFGKYDGISQERIYNKNAYFNRNILYAICVKLILNHPEITDSFLLNCLYYDDNDNVIGINTTDQGTYLIGYKKRKGLNLAEQKILLNAETYKLILILLEMTKDMRESLKKDKNPLYKKLFISAEVYNLFISDNRFSHFAINKQPYISIMNYLKNQHNISEEDSIKFAKNISFTRIRASRGVQVYFETKSTTKMSKALGHTKYDPELLSRYLPDSILDFFQRRWILLFQKGIICEAMKDSEFLLKASNFSNMEALNNFLEKHTLKNIPDNKLNHIKDNNKKDNDDLKIYISVDEEKIAALLSIGRAIEESNYLNNVSSKAIYWKQLGEEIVKEINKNNSYSHYRHIVNNAKNKIRADLFNKVIYE